jgi:1,4-alpha-glucan branching enzyme
MVAPDRVHFLAKDPQWIWIGWHLSAEGRERGAAKAGADPRHAALTLRVHDLSAGGGAAPPFFDVEAPTDADHWYQRLEPNGHTHLVQVGFKAADGRFHAVAESPPLTLPAAGPAEPAAVEERSTLPLRRGAVRGGGGEKGYLLIVLNAHLPFVRHPELEHSHEESWLFENLVESYLPLLRTISALAADGIRPGLTLSLSPTLLEMLADPLLRARALRYAEDHVRLADLEAERWRESPAVARLARLCRDRFEDAARLLGETWSDGLVPRFRELADSGSVEITASCASHAYLPLWAARPEMVELQVKLGAAHYRQTFGRPALGFWLPECGYTPGVDEVLAGAGLRYFFIDAHGVLNGRPRPKLGVHAPVHCPSGVAAFGRDWQSHDLVWRKEVGYPGDPAYLDRSRDRGYELPPEELRAFVHSDTPVAAGLRYWRQGGRDELYDPDLAEQRCAAHAAHFVAACRQRVEELHRSLGVRPVLVALFDAEHFGHWWHEGPRWLDLVIRELAREPGAVRLIGADEYLTMQPTHQIVSPAASSWGYQGYSETWLMGRNQWIYPLLFEAADALRDLGSRASETTRPLLDQYLCELLLAQSSDWAFILHQQTAESYAAARVREHVENMRRLAKGVHSGEIDETWLAAVRRKNNLFASLDLWNLFAGLLKE